MSGKETFTSDKESLEKILDDIQVGKIQLPEFQRGWVWDDDHINSLLASVSLYYPVGAVMLLKKNSDIQFLPRPIEGVTLVSEVEPERFILDGQQRLTSLFQSLCINRPVETKDSRKRIIKRWYYIDMREALNGLIDREQAIKSIPEDKKVKNFRNEVTEDYSTPDLEYKHHLFPLSQVFDCADWRSAYNAYWEHDPEKTKLFDEFEKHVIKNFDKYMVPVITLLEDTKKEAICQVFEKVNTGGVALSVFELLTATFAAEGYRLRDDWEGPKDSKGRKVSEGRMDRIRKDMKVLRSVSATDFLQAVTLLSRYKARQENPEVPVSCKRADVLKLELKHYKDCANSIEGGFRQAGQFLFQQKIFASTDLPYGSQLVPLATIFAILGNDAENDVVRNKLEKWYWCGVFGELYGSAAETRFANDVVQVPSWIYDGPDPKTINDSYFAPSRLFTLRTRRSAAYKGLYALLMRDGCLDFRTGEPIESQTYFEAKIDIHHIFPRDYCQSQGIDQKIHDSVINKTPLSAKTNRIIGRKAPSVYLDRLSKTTGIPDDRMNSILESHIIDPVTMRNDDFETFFEARKEALIQRIEQVTGKAVIRETDEQIREEIDAYAQDDNGDMEE